MKDRINAEFPSLMKAIKQNNCTLSKSIAKSGINLEQKTYFGSHAIIEAAYHGNKEIVEILAYNGADLNVKNEAGYTALIWAVIREHEETIEALLNMGAKSALKDKSGKTALIYAKGNSQIKKLIEQALQLEKKNSINSASIAITKRPIAYKKPIRFN